jgi:hypothetical protein
MELFVRFFRLAGANAFHFFRTLLRWAYSRVKLGKKINEDLASGQSHYVIKCFVYAHSFSKDKGEYHDIFYGRLPNFLTSNNEKIVFFANILGDFRTFRSNISFRLKIFLSLIFVSPYFVRVFVRKFSLRGMRSVISSMPNWRAELGKYNPTNTCITRKLAVF